jgi:hypothetical protein
MRRTFDRERYERALKQQDEATTEADYYAASCALAEAQDRVPNPGMVARAEGRRATRAEWDAWERPLGIGGISASPAGASQRSRPSWHLEARERSRPPAPRRPWDVDAKDPVRDAPEAEAAELEATRPTFEIRLTAGVCTSIQREVVDAMWRFDRQDVESGGWLYAVYPPDVDSVRVVYASGPGPEAKHASGELLLTNPSAASSWVDDVGITSRLRRCGDWHSHPVRDPKPSPKDVSTWETHRRAAGVSHYASLIVTPGKDMGWMAPVFNGYVTHEDEHGVLVCDGAAVWEP